ncbi:HlyD family secretion protein [Thalassotalea sp. ND16A]|uniref:HlyD family secretion protein n=1 Tax=Thalassotalea sp. ND16A TaxID=1535422 RepID=UPI00051A2C93|nr:HlyD family secretion protein [Thalassotalea sp. ND16A]KGK01138.1 hypothetical protein ND16A_3000 [Thalassotalea sp. ND16A]
MTDKITNEATRADTTNTEVENDNKPDFAQRLSKIILILAALYFLWYVIGDRLTPISDQGRVRAFVIPIVPQVSGQISKIYIGGDKRVKEGDILFEIDGRDYNLKVEDAQAKLEMAGQDVGASTAAVAAAKARLDKAEADLVTKEMNASRIFAMEKEGIISGSDADRTRGVITQAELEIINAKAAYEEAQQKLGKAGQGNPKIQAALVELSKAKLDLERTKVRAPSDGVISYAKVNVGYYAAKGQQIMSFISTQYVWVEAAFKENSLGNLKKDDSVDIILDSAPGEVFSGSVISIGFGVSFDKSKPGELPTPENPTGWMKDPQRFTVILKFDNYDHKKLLREGGQADVIAYTGSHFIFNSLGKLWVWVNTYLSYVF